MDLKKQYRAELIWYNFNTPVLSTSKIFNEEPTKEDLLKFLEEKNKKYHSWKTFKMQIEVRQYWQVIK